MNQLAAWTTGPLRAVRPSAVPESLLVQRFGGWKRFPRRPRVCGDPCMFGRASKRADAPSIRYVHFSRGLVGCWLGGPWRMMKPRIAPNARRNVLVDFQAEVVASSGARNDRLAHFSGPVIWG